MLSNYNPHRAASNAPAFRSSVQNQVSNFFQDDFFGDFHREFENLSKGMLSRFDSQFSNFGAPFSSMMRNFDEDFASMANFSNIHNDMGRMNGPGTVIQKSYVSSTVIGKDGKKQHEKYFSNNVAHKGTDGNTISEKQEGYKHSGKGIDRIAQERMLNDKGRKVVKERNRMLNEEAAHNYYYNIEEHQRDEFDRDWMDYNGKVQFIDNHRKALGHNANDAYRLPQRERENVEPPSYQRKNFQDEARRGDYIPSYKKLQSMPVQMNNQPYNAYGDNYFPRARASDLQPTPLPLGNGNIQSNINAPLRGGLPAANQRVPIRNKQDQVNGIFRNRGVAKNEIPKAG